MDNKRLKYLLFSLMMFAGINSRAYCQSKEIPKELYLASTIPDSLKEDANSVVRYAEVIVTVKGAGKETIKFHKIITVLNEKGDDEAEMSMGYNKKYNSYSNIEMRVYNENGVSIKKYRKSDMYDGSATGGETMVTDERFLAVKHTIAAYPQTIETEYEEDVSSNVDLGSWDIQEKEQAIQNSYYHLVIDTNAGFRYQNKNTAIKPKKQVINGMSDYSWVVSNLKAIKLEEGAESWRVLPKIYFAANNFEYYGVPGNINSWRSYGNWQKGLNSDVCSLPPQREAEIRKMTDSIKTDKEKAKFLYNYLQRNTRYVSIQLGIGGLKPFPATFVDEKKYGDCKALANYMVALLKAVNIPAYYAKVRSGANEEPYDPDFPFDLSNHIIVCVPFKGDTTWLECTSNTQQFGMLGPFTENRNALIVTDEGGKLVQTPRSSMQENQFNSETHIKLETDGSAKAQIRTLSTGEIRSLFVDYLPTYNVDKQKEALLNYLNIKQPSIFDFQLGNDQEGVKEVNLNLEYDKFCDIMAGDKQFYHTWVVNYWDFTVPIIDKRKTDYYFKYPLQGSSVTEIDLPAGFEVETLPSNQSLKFTYGNYEIKYVYDPSKNQVVSTAKFNLTNHVIPAAKYTEMQQYLDAVAKAQNKKLVIRRKA